MPIVSSKLRSLTNLYTYKELSEMTGVPHPRIIEAANNVYLNETTLRIFMGGEVITLADLSKAELTEKDIGYLQELEATSDSRIVTRLRKIIEKYGKDEAVKLLDALLKK